MRHCNLQQGYFNFGFGISGNDTMPRKPKIHVSFPVHGLKLKFRVICLVTYGHSLNNEVFVFPVCIGWNFLCHNLLRGSGVKILNLNCNLVFLRITIGMAVFQDCILLSFFFPKDGDSCFYDYLLLEFTCYLDSEFTLYILASNWEGSYSHHALLCPLGFITRSFKGICYQNSLV